MSEITLRLRREWVDEVRAAIGEGGSNDDEHELLLEALEAAVAGRGGLAAELAVLLNDGMGQVEAVAKLGIDPEEISTEDPCLVLGDRDNGVIDLCDGTLVRSTPRHEFYVWHVERYAQGG